MKLFSLVLLLSATVSAQWIKQSVNTTASFRGLSVVNEKIVWASGTGGTVIRTVDGGKTWNVMTVPGAEKLDFRDIEAFDANTAYILSIGNGDASRIYKTTDGGTTWKLQFTNTNEKAFFDAIACWDRNNCLAMSDPVDGHYVLLSTDDGGATGTMINTSKMPAAKEGEAAFAASGTCLITVGMNQAFLVSGGTDARVFRSQDRGLTWTVADTPIMKGSPGSGIFSIAMYDAKNGVIVGGNYEKPEERNSTFASTEDGGAHWREGARPRGFRSGVAFIDRDTVIAVGTNGSDLSFDRSVNWRKIGEENLNAVAAKGRNAIWSVGPKGGVYRLGKRSLITSDARTKASYPHIINISSLRLSHSLIAADCSSTEKACSKTTTIDVAAAGPRMEDLPHEYAYIVSEGKVIGDGENVRWDLAGAKPGKYTITAGIRIPFLGGSYWDFGGVTKTQEVIVR